MADRADFAPELGALKSLRPFVFWAQTTLPTVFDDSLSYYEVLTKLCKMVNTMLENEDTNAENIAALAEAYQELEDFTNNYFENLDVTQEINDKLDELVADGTIEGYVVDRANTLLNEYLYGEDGESGKNKEINDMISEAQSDIEEALANFATRSNQAVTTFELNSAASIQTFQGRVDEQIAGISTIVEDWMNDNFTNPSSVVIDDTLTVKDAAAEAYATGKLMDDATNMILATAYWQDYVIDSVSGSFILADVSGGSNPAIGTGAPAKTLYIANVTPGETYIVSGVASSYSTTRYTPAYALGNLTYDASDNPYYEFYDVYPRGWDETQDPGTVYQYVRNQVVRIPTGTTPTVTHLFIVGDNRVPITVRCSKLNVRTDDTLTSQSLPAQGKAVGDAIENLQDRIVDLDGIFSKGANLFDKTSVTENKIMTQNGEVTLTNGAYSDYIPVEPSTTYYISRGLGSSSRPSLVEFDGEKVALSQTVRQNTNKFSITTSADTHFLIVNTTIAYLDTFTVSVSDIKYYSEFGYVGGGKVSKFSLVSASPIYYDSANLVSKTSIMLIQNDNAVELGTTVNVGSGIFLLYNSTTGALYASDEYGTASNIYLVTTLKRFDYTNNNNFACLASLYAPLKLDAINKTVTITCTSQSYLYVNGAFITLSSDKSATLTATTNHYIVYYSMTDGVFNLTSSYNAIKNSDVVIAEIYRGTYHAICEVKVINGISAKNGDVFFTFGDSLTWYDGHEFNRGEYEGEICNGYQSYLANYCGMALNYNAGSSGKTTPQICSILESFDFSSVVSNAVTVFIMGGNNDDRLNVPIGTLLPVGSTFDTTTIYGALQHAIETVQAAHPQYRIIMMTEPMGWTYKNGALSLVNPLIAEAYRRVAETYALPLIDLWKESGINALNRDTFYADPPAATNSDYMYHPNNLGWERLSRIICREVLKL